MSQITVIIPAYNEEKNIDECLRSLTTQSVREFKAVIIDDASTDRTVEIIEDYVKKYPGKIALKQYGKVGPGRARNLAAKDVDSEFIAFMDADCIATDDWLAELLKGFRDDSIGSVGGPHLAPPDSTPFQRAVESFFIASSSMIDFYKPPSDEMIEVPHNPLCNVAYRRGVFHAVRGFREDLFPGEDVEIDFKVKDLGYKILYNSRARVHHHRPESIEQFRKVMHAYGRSQAKLIREYGVKRKIQWLGVLVIFALAMGAIALTSLFGLVGFIGALTGVLLFFFVRPPMSGKLGIYLNALHWFNGLVEGLITNRSLPPGYQKPKA